MTAKEHRILTAVGPDQVGLVERLSEFIVRHGCNIEDSKMAVFCGEFAVIVLASGDAASLDRLAGNRAGIETATGLAIAIKTPAARKPAELSIPYRLTASCMDYPGIVNRISSVLTALGINIESMETQTYSAPVSGTPLFRLDANLSVPARIGINELRERMAEIQREQNIDVELTAGKG